MRFFQSQWAVLTLFLALTLSSTTLHADPPPRPNIVWIVVDDMSPNFSCYGETLIQTPIVDRLAVEGTRFTNAYVTAPVCSTCRSALITGCYQTTIGSHHHRSGRGKLHITLPVGVEPVPALFQRSGYHTSIGGPLVGKSNKLGKTDYNFDWDESIYDANDWAGRKPSQPFFHQVQLHGGKYRGQDLNPRWTKDAKKYLGSVTSPDQVKLPAHCPDDPVLREDWARYLDCVRYTDQQVGDVVNRLKQEGLLDQTVIFFITDHGISHARGKQFLYDEGIHIPFVIRGPGIKTSATRTDLVQQIDLAPTSLALAGISIPSGMQGKNILADDYKPRDAIYAARDRCDETVEHLRAVRTDQFKYIRNYLPLRPMLQPNRYKDDKAIVQRLRELHESHQLADLHETLLFSPTRPKEELYDLKKDPGELHNLAENPANQPMLEELRGKLARWEEESNDLGRVPESEAMYDSDMAVYGARKGRSRSPLDDNIDLMKRWAKEGK